MRSTQTASSIFEADLPPGVEVITREKWDGSGRHIIGRVIVVTATSDDIPSSIDVLGEFVKEVNKGFTND